MGATNTCCTIQPGKNVGRHSIPTQLDQIPILNAKYNNLPNPSCQQLYGQFHNRVNPPKLIEQKVPVDPKLRTKHIWKQVQLWQYPIQRIKTLTCEQIKYRTFQQKHEWFKGVLDNEKAKYGKGYNKIKVDPTNVLLSSYQNFNQINFNLQTKIIFSDDKGAIDAGGLFREWVNMCIIQAFSPELGMFKLCETDQTAYKICVNKTNLQIFTQVAKILGFIIGKSMIQRIPLDCYLNRTILRMLTNQSIHLCDVYSYDSQIYTSLKSILDNTISQQDLINFTTRIKDPFTNQQKEIQLIPNGCNVFVNDQNKHQFVQRMIKILCEKSIAPIIKQLKNSLYQVVPYTFLQVFQPYQLEMIICGRQFIDVLDWMKYTNYKCFNQDKRLINWFWDIVTGFDQKLKSNLLHFCTGTTKVPIQGFKYLQCKRGKIKHFNIKLVEYNPDNPYPKGITCFNKLQLPPYNSKQQLESMLLAVCQQQIHDFGLDNIKH